MVSNALQTCFPSHRLRNQRRHCGCDSPCARCSVRTSSQSVSYPPRGGRLQGRRLRLEGPLPRPQTMLCVLCFRSPALVVLHGASRSCLEAMIVPIVAFVVFVFMFGYRHATWRWTDPAHITFSASDCVFSMRVAKLAALFSEFCFVCWCNRYNTWALPTTPNHEGAITISQKLGTPRNAVARARFLRRWTRFRRTLG
jgi:hypothetical protein